MKNDEQSLDKIPERGIKIKVTRFQMFRSVWYARFATLFFWFYKIYPMKGFRLLGRYFLKKAYSFFGGKIPVTNETMRRQSIQADNEYFERELDYEPPEKYRKSSSDS